MATFIEKLRAKWNEGKFVCVGLDSELEKIPEAAQVHTFSRLDTDAAGTIILFNQVIVNATKDLVLAYKPNLAFYVAHGKRGLWTLRDTVQYIRTVAPDVPVILDAKSMDIGNTNAGYVRMAFEYCDADAITVNPYLGMEAAQPFLDQKDKGVIVLCRTSNKGAGEFQDLNVSIPYEELEYLQSVKACPWSYGPGMPSTTSLYNHVAYRVSKHWNANGNCALVVGATYPEELASVRRIVGDMPILIPGIGAQGGDVEATVKAGMDSQKQGMIINSSRGIIFASDGPDFAEAARRETLELHNLINQYRN